VPDNADTPAVTPTPRFSLFGKRPTGEATRAQVVGLDRLERNLGFFAAFIGFLASSFAFKNYITGKSTSFVETAKPNAKHLCQSGYHLVTSLCEKTVTQSHGYWAFQFWGLFGMALLVGFASWRRNRPMLIVVSLLVGVIAGSAGLLFIGLGAWLLIRAFRMQRYGDPTFKGSNAVARSRAQARPPRQKRSATEVTSPVRAAPTQSKRYTPKKKTKR
jgi:hypothetical protein